MNTAIDATIGIASITRIEYDFFCKNHTMAVQSDDTDTNIESFAQSKSYTKLRCPLRFRVTAKVVNANTQISCAPFAFDWQWNASRVPLGLNFATIDPPSLCWEIIAVGHLQCCMEISLVSAHVVSKCRMALTWPGNRVHTFATPVADDVGATSVVSVKFTSPPYS